MDLGDRDGNEGDGGKGGNGSGGSGKKGKGVGKKKSIKEKRKILCAAGEIPRMVDEIEDEILSQITEEGDPGKFFQLEDLGGRYRVSRKGSFIKYTPAELESIIEQWCEFRMVRKAGSNGKGKGASKKLVKVDIPSRLAIRVLDNCANSKVPTVKRVLWHPIVSAETGKLVGISDKGNWIDNGILFRFRGKIRVTGGKEGGLDRARKLYKWLIKEVCCDIPFDSKVSEVAYISLLLSLVTRGSVQGGWPGYLINAHRPGTGKSTAVEIAHRIATGMPVSSMSLGYGSRDSGEELSKIIGSALMSSTEVLCWDNVKEGTEIRSELLAQAISQGFVSARVLGKSHLSHLDANRVFIFCGNNLSLSPELTRRVIRVGLVLKSKSIYERKFKKPTILRWVEQNRSLILGVLLELLQLLMYENQKRGRGGGGKMSENKFESGFGFWDVAVRDGLKKLTDIDLVSRMIEEEEHSEEMTTHEAIIRLWVKVFGVKKGVKSIDVYNVLADADEGEEMVLKSMIETLNGRAFRNMKSLGKALTILNGLTVDEWIFRKKRTKYGTEYCVEKRVIE